MPHSEIRDQTPPGGFWYIATPYTQFPTGLQDAFETACRVTAELMRHGIPCFSPIAHSHPLAIIGGLDPVDHELWMRSDAPMLNAACGCLVVMLPGWRDSRGVAHEIAEFTSHSKPIHFLEYPL
jgi:hypothetical protein